MSRITLSGTVPQEATNGLAQHAKDFIEHPRVLVPVVALIAVQKITTKPETGEEYPTIRIHHIEIVGEKHRKQHAKMLGDALAGRTGIAELPFEAGGEVPLKQDPFPEDTTFASGPDDTDDEDESEGDDE